MNFNIVVILITVVSALLPKELNFLLATFAVIVVSRYNTSVIGKSLITLWPIILLLVVGMLSAFEHSLNDLSRDLFLVLKIVTFFVAGAIVSKYLNNINTIFQCLKIVAILSATQHIFFFFQNLSLLGSLDMFRQVVGRSSFPEMLYLAMVISAYFNRNLRQYIRRHTVRDKVMIFVIFCSFILYFSRTMILSTSMIVLFLINIVNLRNVLQANNGRIAIFASFVLLIGLLVVEISSSVGGSESQMGTLMSKFENIPNELFWSKSKTARATLGEINANWRGYESYQGLLKFYNGSESQMVLGHGWGTLVDLGLTIQFAGSEYTKIPILHNGFVTLLVKTGVLGVLLYVVFLYMMGAKKINNLKMNSETYYVYQLLSAIALATFLNTFTTAGLLSVADIFSPFLLGLLWAIPGRKRKAIRRAQVATATHQYHVS